MQKTAGRRLPVNCKSDYAPPFYRYLNYFLIFTALFVFSSCKYSFKGALPSDLKTIAIPLFEDRSRWVGLQEKMTQGVIEAFIEDNNLQVIEDESQADLLLTGTILPVQTRRTAITSDETVEEEQMVVTVKLDCTNQRTDKPLWGGNVSDFGTISGSASLDERDTAVDFATEKIITEIINRTIGAW